MSVGRKTRSLVEFRSSARDNPVYHSLYGTASRISFFCHLSEMPTRVAHALFSVPMYALPILHSSRVERASKRWLSYSSNCRLCAANRKWMRHGISDANYRRDE